MEARWYIVNAVSGFEPKVAVAIRDLAEKKGVADKFLEVIVPTESVAEVRRGKKIVTDKKIYPGYILVKMYLDDFCWNLVRSIPKVTGFLGSSGKPLPVSEREIQEVMRQIEGGAVAKEIGAVFAVGDSVRIKEGAFDTFTGVVEDVDADKSLLRISVSIFGRATPVELAFNQVDKL